MDTPATERPAVVIVVPVYGDLPSLLECVDSLVRHVDLERHRVLLVNDCGPEADGIEAALLRVVAGRPGLRYERNERNLGFVGTCNRAVLELDQSDDDVLLLNSDTVVTAGFLDEMHDVLLAHEHHGVVCARSNNATIASLPFRQLHARDRSTERTLDVFEEISPVLPRWYVTPVAMGFCFLTRRSLIRRHGLFDDAFAPGYGEENDYCLRLDAAGTSAVMANRALVLHAGSKSFVGPTRNRLRDAHQKLLEARYPFYGDAVSAFLRYDVHPADRFADALVGGAGRERAVVDMRGLSSVTAGRARWERTALALEEKMAADDFEVEFLVDEADVTAFSGLLQGRVSAVQRTDAISTLGILFAELIDGSRLVEANLRFAAWIFVEGEEDQLSWSRRALRPGAPHVASVARRLATAVLAADGQADWSEAASSWTRATLAEKIEVLVTRWDVVSTMAAVSEATTEPGERPGSAVRDELAALKSSRTYRLAARMAAVARRLPRRHRLG